LLEINSLLKLGSYKDVSCNKASREEFEYFL